MYKKWRIFFIILYVFILHNNFSYGALPALPAIHSLLSKAPEIVGIASMLISGVINNINNSEEYINWETDLQSAIIKANKNKYPIIILLCDNQKIVDDDKAYTSKYKGVSKVLFVVLNKEKEEAQKIIKKYNINKIPAVISFNINGQKLGIKLKHELLQDNIIEDQLKEYVKNVIDENKKINKQRLGRKPSIEKLDLHIQYEEEKEASIVFYKLLDDNKIPQNLVPEYLLKLSLISSDNKKSLEYLNYIINTYPQSKYVYDAHYYKALILSAYDKNDAEIYLEKLIDDINTPKSYKKLYKEFISYIKKMN